MNNYNTLITSILILASSFLYSCHPKLNTTKSSDIPQISQQAYKIADEVIITDGHIDFPYRFRDHYGEITSANSSVAIDSQEGEFDYKRAKAGGLDAPFMSIYIPASYQESGGAKELADSLIDFVDFIVEQYPENFGKGRSPGEINRNFEKGLVSLPMGMENGAPIGNDLDLIDYFYNRGIRYITLTHSKWNQICDSSYDPEHKWNGLSPFGYKVIQRMNETGIMVDVSHISDSAFYQVINTTRTPVIASHSSCRVYTPGFERNMSDDMIRKMKENGGVIQINFGSDFLDSQITKNREEYKAKWAAFQKEKMLDEKAANFKKEEQLFKKRFALPLYSNVGKVADHIDHVVRLAGIDYVGLGSDYDGVGDSLPDGLKDVSQYPRLITELLKRGYTREDIEKICYKNVWRVWNAVQEYAQTH